MQINPSIIQQKILEEKFVPLFTSTSLEQCSKALKACYKAGLRIFEFTNRNDNSLEIFIALKRICTNEMPGMFLGAGTIKNAHEATQFINAGADFLISPLWHSEIFNATNKSNILWIPGCATASEIGMAATYKIELIKIFPARLLGGPSFIKTMKEIFPSTHLLATGGVEPSAKDLQSWFDAGVDAVGIGSKLFSKKAMESPDENIFMEVIMKIKSWLPQNNFKAVE